MTCGDKVLALTTQSLVSTSTHRTSRARVPKTAGRCWRVDCLAGLVCRACRIAAAKVLVDGSVIWSREQREMKETVQAVVPTSKWGRMSIKVVFVMHYLDRVAFGAFWKCAYIYCIATGRPSGSINLYWSDQEIRYLVQGSAVMISPRELSAPSDYCPFQEGASGLTSARLPLSTCLIRHPSLSTQLLISDSMSTQRIIIED